MPNWKTHLEIGRRIGNALSYDEEKLNLFLLGNILPDINNGYIVKNISKRLPHHVTHYSETPTPSYLQFESKFKHYFTKNPVILGYYIHLYTDYTWNNDFYTKITQRKMDYMDHETLKVLKQTDFKRYNNNFCENNSIQIKNLDKAIEELKGIDKISITKADLKEVMQFLDAQKAEDDGDFEFYKKEELDKILEETVENVVKMVLTFDIK